MTSIPPEGGSDRSADLRRRTTRQTIIGLTVVSLLLIGVVAIALVSDAREGLRVDVLSPRRAEPGEAIEVRVVVRDVDGGLRRVEVDLADGRTVVPVDDNDPECRDDPWSESVDVAHTYPEAGLYTVRATVSTGGCGARSEQVEAIRTIDVKPLRR